MTVVYTLEHAQRFLRDEQAISDPSRYPPLWFRMEDSFAVNSWVSGRRSTGLPEGQVRADRYRQEGRISSVLMEVGNTHPLIVEWLGPAIDGSRTSTYQSILCDSRKLLSQLDIPSGND